MSVVSVTNMRYGHHLSCVVPVEVEEGILHCEGGRLLVVQLVQQLPQVVVLVRYNELVQVLVIICQNITIISSSKLYPAHHHHGVLGDPN